MHFCLFILKQKLNGISTQSGKFLHAKQTYNKRIREVMKVATFCSSPNEPSGRAFSKYKGLPTDLLPSQHSTKTIPRLSHAHSTPLVVHEYTQKHFSKTCEGVSNSTVRHDPENFSIDGVGDTTQGLLYK